MSLIDSGILIEKGNNCNTGDIIHNPLLIDHSLANTIDATDLKVLHNSLKTIIDPNLPCVNNSLEQQPPLKLISFGRSGTSKKLSTPKNKTLGKRK